jgi:hypothetical protein
LILDLRRLEPLDVVRRRAIRETEAALLFGLTHPESTARIPRVEVGRAAFSAGYARDFWAGVLGSEESA